jgi:hypothetical protein
LAPHLGFYTEQIVNAPRLPGKNCRLPGNSYRKRPAKKAESAARRLHWRQRSGRADAQSVNERVDFLSFDALAPTHKSGPTIIRPQRSS